jgi:hypothetical protein
MMIVSLIAVVGTLCWLVFTFARTVRGKTERCLLDAEALRTDEARRLTALADAFRYFTNGVQISGCGNGIPLKGPLAF